MEWCPPLLGDTKPVKADVRVIAATNEDLFEKSHNKAFRLDLHFRLRVVEISLPPLRERGDDIELLAETLLQRLCQRLGRPGLSLQGGDRVPSRLQLAGQCSEAGGYSGDGGHCL
jgi:transcriptional regulator with GAF, ATPase, and Fis domain